MDDSIMCSQGQVIQALDNKCKKRSGLIMNVIKEETSDEPKRKMVKKTTSISARDQKLSQIIVDQVKEELQTWSIPAIVAREQFMTDCWMKNAQAMATNSKLAANVNLKFERDEG